MVKRGAGPVLDHDGLAELRAKLGGEHAGDRVGRAAGRLRDDQADRPVRIGGLRGRASGQRP